MFSPFEIPRTKMEEGPCVNSGGTLISGLTMTQNEGLSTRPSISGSDRMGRFLTRFWLSSWFNEAIHLLFLQLCGELEAQSCLWCPAQQNHVTIISRKNSHPEVARQDVLASCVVCAYHDLPLSKMFSFQSYAAMWIFWMCEDCLLHCNRHLGVQWLPAGSSTLLSSPASCDRFVWNTFHPESLFFHGRVA